MGLYGLIFSLFLFIPILELSHILSMWAINHESEIKLVECWISSESRYCLA